MTSRRRLFPVGGKVSTTCRMWKGGRCRKTAYDLEVCEKRSSRAMVSRKDLCHAQLEFFTPDCWRIVGGDEICMRSSKAAAGAFYRVFPELQKDEKIRLIASRFNNSSQTEQLICTAEYSEADFHATDFVWLPVGCLKLTHNDLMLSLLHRLKINWRFGFLLDQYRDKEVKLGWKCVIGRKEALPRYRRHPGDRCRAKRNSAYITALLTTKRHEKARKFL